MSYWLEIAICAYAGAHIGSEIGCLRRFITNDFREEPAPEAALISLAISIALVVTVIINA